MQKDLSDEHSPFTTFRSSLRLDNVLSNQRMNLGVRMAPSFAQCILYLFVFIKQMCWETIMADAFSLLKLPSVRRPHFNDN